MIAIEIVIVTAIVKKIAIAIVTIALMIVVGMKTDEMQALR